MELMVNTLLPLLQSIARPERLGALVNFVAPEVLLAVFRAVKGKAIFEFIDSLDDEDLEPEGSAIQFMDCLERF